VALKSAEMWGQLKRLNGLEPSRGPSFKRASAQARDDFRALLARNEASAVSRMRNSGEE
jgi:hypothetical protein